MRLSPEILRGSNVSNLVIEISRKEIEEAHDYYTLGHKNNSKTDFFK